MDVRTDVPFVTHKRPSRSQTHPHPARASRQPIANRKRRLDRSRRGREGNQKGVSLRVNLDAVKTCASLADKPAMFRKRHRISLRAKLLEQPRRALDVAEEQGDRSGRTIP